MVCLLPFGLLLQLLCCLLFLLVGVLLLALFFVLLALVSHCFPLLPVVLLCRQFCLCVLSEYSCLINNNKFLHLSRC